MHSASVDAVDRFCHESRVHAVCERNRLRDVSERDDIVRHLKRIAVFEINLVLGFCDLVVGCFDDEAHIGQRNDDIAADVLGAVGRRQIKVAAVILELEARFAVNHPEEEEFEFGTRIEGVSHILGFFHGFLEDISRVALEGGAVGLIDVADKTGFFDAAVLLPRKQCVCCDIWSQDHIGLFYTREPFYRRSVKGNAVGERFFRLNLRDCDVFDLSLNIGELKADELHVVVFNPFEHVRDLFFGITRLGECFHNNRLRGVLFIDMRIFNILTT